MNYGDSKSCWILSHRPMRDLQIAHLGYSISNVLMKFLNLSLDFYTCHRQDFVSIFVFQIMAILRLYKGLLKYENRFFLHLYHEFISLFLLPLSHISKIWFALEDIVLWLLRNLGLCLSIYDAMIFHLLASINLWKMLELGLFLFLISIGEEHR